MISPAIYERASDFGEKKIIAVAIFDTGCPDILGQQCQGAKVPRPYKKLPTVGGERKSIQSNKRRYEAGIRRRIELE
jgi:hypothetical protein